MQGIGIARYGRTAAFFAALLACCALGASLTAGGADARDYSYTCSTDAIQVTQTGNRLDAKGRLECAGNGVRRAIVRVCLLQTGPSGRVVVKCATRARNGTGNLRVLVSRTCAKGPNTGFITRVNVRLKLVDGQVKKQTQSASANRFPRDCTPG